MVFEIKDKSGKVIATFGSELEAYWNNIKDQCERSIFDKKRAIEIDEKVLEMAKLKIKKEIETQKRVPKKSPKSTPVGVG